MMDQLNKRLHFTCNFLPKVHCNTKLFNVEFIAEIHVSVSCMNIGHTQIGTRILWNNIPCMFTALI